MKPMRPGFSLPPLDTYDGPIPNGWVWQYKLDDERAILTPDGTLWNRFGTKIAGHKAKVFAPAVARLHDVLPGVVADVALLGYRGHVFCPGPVVVLDFPELPGGFLERYKALAFACCTYLPGESDSDWPYYLTTYDDPYWLFRSSRKIPGVEGIIGRNPNAPYIQGDSRDMCKSKHS